MMEVVWKSSMFGGYFIWIGLLVLYGLVQVTVSTDTTSLTCAGKQSCNMTTLSCKDQHRISLMRHQYNYNEESNQCTIDNSNGRCIIHEGCKTQLKKWHVYPLYTSCSGLNTCTVAATSVQYNCNFKNDTTTKVQSDSTKVTYSCVNDTGGDILRFCKDRLTKTSNSVDIIFNGTDTHKSVQNQTCTCTVTGNSTDRIVLQDFRLLQPDNTPVCSSVKIKGFGKTCNVTKKQWKNFVYLRNLNLSVITLENLFAKGANDRPTMVWIRVKAGGSELKVNCTAPSSGIPLTQPTTTSTTTTTITTTATTTEQSTPSSTENDDKSSTNTNTKSSSDTITTVVTRSSDVMSSTVTTDEPGDVAAQDSTDTANSSVPAVAIVVPVLLICVGLATALGIWFWRRHRRGGDRQLTDTKHNLTYGRNGGPAGPCAETTKKASKNAQNKPPINTEHLDDDNYDYAMPVDEIKANEDENNVSSLKSKPVVFYPSYDHLPNAKNEFQTDSDEYSHITNLSSPIKTDINASMDVYSHLERPSTSSQNASVTSDVMGIYSHLKGERPVQVTPTALATKSEDDTYDHALSFGATQRHNQSARTMNTGLLLSCNLDNSPSAQSGERPPDTDGDHEYFILERVQYKP